MKKSMLVVCMAAMGLAGCATYTEPKFPAYEDGYSAGCADAKGYDSTEIPHKDFSRAHDRAYMIGWDEGFSECRYNIYRNHADGKEESMSMHHQKHAHHHGKHKHRFYKKHAAK